MLIMAIVYVANLILLVVVALNESKRPIWALPWVIICTILPIIGFISYYMLTKKASRTVLTGLGTLDSRDSVGAVVSRNSVGSVNLGSTWTSQTAAEFEDAHPDGENTSIPIITEGLHKLGFRIHHASVKLMANGVETFDSLIHALSRAQHSIDVDFYIYRNDDIGNIITNLLIQKARSGVKVRFVRDAIGSYTFPKSEVIRMQTAGIECKVFHPVRFPWLRPSLNQRDHGKIVIIDRTEAFIGGVNIGNEYTGQDPVKGPWRDTEMHMISDDLMPLAECFEANWRQATPEGGKAAVQEGGAGSFTAVPPPHPRPLPLVRFETAAELHPDSSGIAPAQTQADDLDNMDSASGQAPTNEQYLYTSMQTVYGNPDIRTDAMRELFFLCITEAKNTVDVTTPYFAPDADLVMALKVATLRNVRIRLLVPRNPDHKLIGLASRTYYPELLLAGVEIYLHEKGILHAKTIVSDHCTSVVGATNFDLRSFHLNREVCEVMHSPEVASQLTRQFELDLLDASRMTQEDAESSPIERIKERGARLFAPFL